jgi:hypothetical protein
MSYTKPLSHDGIAIDSIIPRTGATTPIGVKPSSGGTEYFQFDSTNARIRTNKIAPYSGSEIDMQAARLTNLGTPTGNAHAATKLYVDGAWDFYTAAFVSAGGMTYSGTSIVYARFWTHTDRVFLQLYIAATLGGTAHNEVIITLPSTPSGQHQLIPANLRQTKEVLVGEVDTSDNRLHLYRAGLANFALGYSEFTVSGFYRKA